jgi:hypothetical protein
MSACFNVLFLLKKISDTVLYAGFAVLVFIVLLVSILGFIMKNVRKDAFVTINILTPSKEYGFLYFVTLVTWTVTYFLTMIFK